MSSYASNSRDLEDSGFAGRAGGDEPFVGVHVVRVVPNQFRSDSKRLVDPGKRLESSLYPSCFSCVVALA